jgi:hypothetical protein
MGRDPHVVQVALSSGSNQSAFLTAARKLILRFHRLSGLVVTTWPGTDPWDPSRNTTAERFVFWSKGSPQSWLFVPEYEQVESQPDERTIRKQASIRKNQSLANDDGHNGDVHRISDITIQSGDYQVTRRKNRGGRAQPFDRETGK